MRILDVTSAVTIGIVSLLLISLINPSNMIQYSDSLALKTKLRAEILTVVNKVGFYYLQNSSPEQLCDLSNKYSNSTFQIVFSENRNERCIVLSGLCVSLQISLATKILDAEACKREAP